MTEFGGMGGVVGGRPFCPEDLFEAAVERALGEQIRQSVPRGWSSAEYPYSVGEQMWSALANQDWRHDNGDTAGYSFRAAGDLIAAIHGSGDYMDWYCTGPYATVSELVLDALAKEGWHPIEMPDGEA